MNNTDIYPLIRLLSIRAIGNTMLLLEGAKRFDKPFFICGHTTDNARRLVRASENENAIPVGIGDMLRTMSHLSPIILDHAALLEVIQGMQFDNNQLTEKVGQLRQRIADLEKERDEEETLP